MITAEQFFIDHEGKPLDFDGFYGSQCMDVAQFYNRDVCSAPVLKGNAIDVWSSYPQDFYEKIVNTPDNFPLKGDIIIWNAGRFGHIAVCSKADVNQITSFEQNWPIQGYTDKQGNFIGTGVCHFQLHPNYQGVLGWLRPKNRQDQQQNVPNLAPILLTVTSTGGVFVRSDPSTKNTPIKKALPGSTLFFAAAVQGEMVSGNNVWFKLTDGSYVWSGAVYLAKQPSPPPPPLPGDPGTPEYDQNRCIQILKAFTSRHGGNLEGAANMLTSDWEDRHQTTSNPDQGGLEPSN